MASIALRKKKTLLQYNRRAFVLVVYGEVATHSLVALIPVVAIAGDIVKSCVSATEHTLRFFSF